MLSSGWLYTSRKFYNLWQLYSDGFWTAHCLLPLGDWVAVLLSVCMVHIVARDSYTGCSTSGHRGQCYGCCQYEHAVRCASGSSGGEAGEVGPRVVDLPAVETLPDPPVLLTGSVLRISAPLPEGSSISAPPVAPGEGG